MDAADARDAAQAFEHLLQAVARPHRTLAVIRVIEEFCPRRPGEHQGFAAKADSVGEVHGIERRSLEGLVEAVDIDENVAAACRRADQVDDLEYRLERFEVPVLEP